MVHPCLFPSRLRTIFANTNVYYPFTSRKWNRSAGRSGSVHVLPRTLRDNHSLSTDTYRRDQPFSCPDRESNPGPSCVRLLSYHLTTRPADRSAPSECSYVEPMLTDTKYWCTIMKNQMAPGVEPSSPTWESGILPLDHKDRWQIWKLTMFLCWDNAYKH